MADSLVYKVSRRGGNYWGKVRIKEVGEAGTTGEGFGVEHVVVWHAGPLLLPCK